MSLSTNGAAVLRKMTRRGAAVKRALQQAARELVPLMAAENKRLIQSEIYDVPIPLKAGADKRLGQRAVIRTKTTKGSSGKWQRTGNLKRAETATADGVDVLMRNNADYGAARYALGGPNPPNRAGRRAGTQRPQTGVPDAQKSKTRSVQWHSETIEKQRPRIVKVRREAVLRALVNP